MGLVLKMDRAAHHLPPRIGFPSVVLTISCVNVDPALFRRLLSQAVTEGLTFDPRFWTESVYDVTVVEVDRSLQEDMEEASMLLAELRRSHPPERPLSPPPPAVDWGSLPPTQRLDEDASD